MENKIQYIQNIYDKGLQDQLTDKQRAIGDELIRQGIIKTEASANQNQQGSLMNKVEAVGQGPAVGLAAKYAKGFSAGLSEKGIAYIGAAIAKLGGDEAVRNMPFGQLVDMAKEIRQEQEAKLEQERPIASTAAEIGGAILSPAQIPAAKVAKLAGGGLKGLAAGGATSGAIFGAGYGEDLTDIKATSRDILEGGSEGAGFGVALGATGKAVGAIGGKVSKVVTPVAANVLQRFIPNKAARISIKNSLRKEKIDAREALKKMDEDNLMLSEVVDPSSRLITQIEAKTYETTTKGLLEKRVQELADSGAKAVDETMNLVSNKVVSSKEAAQLIGKNASAIIQKLKDIRKSKAEALYAKANDVLINPNDPILKIPALQKAIATVRDESFEFGDETIASLKDLPNNALPVLQQAKKYLYKKSKDFTDLQNSRYNELYHKLNNKLSEASKDYAEASKLWADDTAGIEQLYNTKGIGNIARNYDNNKLDSIEASLKNIFKPKTVSEREINSLRQAVPKQDEFAAIVRKDLQYFIDENIQQGISLKKALFGAEDLLDRGTKINRLKLLLTPEQIKGLDKLVSRIDLLKAREKVLGKVKFGEGLDELPTPTGGKYSLINNITRFINYISETPASREAYLKFVLSPRGKSILEDMSKSETTKNLDSIIFKTIQPLLTQTQDKNDSNI